MELGVGWATRVAPPHPPDCSLEYLVSAARVGGAREQLSEKLLSRSKWDTASFIFSKYRR